MNNTYRVIRNKATGGAVVVSELAKSHSGGGVVPPVPGCSVAGGAGNVTAPQKRARSTVLMTGVMALLMMAVGPVRATDYTAPVVDADLQSGDTITLNGDGVSAWKATVAGVTRTANDNVITTHGNGSYAVEVGNQATMVLNNATIVTTGTLNSPDPANPDPNNDEGSYGVYVGGGGTVTLNGGAITTSGKGSSGIEVDKGNTHINADGVVITVNGAGFSANIPNAGVRSFGSTTRVKLSNTQIITHNDFNYGIFLNSTGGTLEVDHATITTNGDHSYGIFSNSENINSISDSIVETFGANSPALAPESSSLVNIGFTRGSVHTHGLGSAGVATHAGSGVRLVDTTVTADMANGAVIGNPSETRGGTIYLANSTIETGTAGLDAVVINHAGSSFTSDTASILRTVADNAHGLTVAMGAQLTFDPLHNGLIPHFEISGNDSAALHVTGSGSAITMQNGATLDTSLATLGPGAFGLLAENGGHITLLDTSKVDGVGVWARGTAADGVGRIEFHTNATMPDARVRIDDYGFITIQQVLDANAISIKSLEGGGPEGNGVFYLGALSGGHNVTINGDNATTYASGIQGDGNLIRTGIGSLTLTGEHGFDFNGNVQIHDTSTFGIGGDAQAPGKIFTFFDPDAKLDISTSDSGAEVGAIQSQNSGAGHIILGNTGSPKDLTVKSNSVNSDFNGSITGEGALVKDGTATMTLSGAHVFDFVGDTHIVNGTLAVVGATSATGHNFELEDAGILNVSGANGGNTNFNVGMIDGSGNVVIGGNSLTVDGANAGVFSGTLSGSGDLIKTNSGSLTLSGLHAFDYTGATQIQGGVLTLEMDAADRTAFTKTFTLDGGWLDLSQVYDGDPAHAWDGVTTVDGVNAANGGVIGLDDNFNVGSASDGTFAGQIGDGIPGSGNDGVYVVKTGSGTTELTGVNHYVGNTRIEDGILKVSADSNLGNTTIDREVVLNGGKLEIAGSFTSNRDIELRQNGSVIVDAGQDTTLGGLRQAGGDFVFTKEGDGALTFAQGGEVGAIAAAAGALTMIGGSVDSSALGTAAVTANGSSAITFAGTSITSADDAIVSTGTNTVTLTDVTLNAGAGHALYHVTAGAGTLNANNMIFAGDIVADAGATLNLNLDQGSEYTGVVTRGAGSIVNMALNDAESTWNLTGDATVDALTNSGRIKFGAPSGATYQSLMVNGAYVGGGSLGMHTELNLGGDPANQHTDRLLIKGDVSGTTMLDVDTTGAGDNTNIGNTHNKIPTEGISLVQVGGNAAADSFKLRGDYVLSTPAAGGASPFQYRLFAYGPGQTAQSQSQLGAGSTLNWDYRLETAYIDDHGTVVPGVCTTLPAGSDPDTPCPGGGGGGDDHPIVAPQATTYLTVGPALQNYGVVTMEALNRRLGEMRRDAESPSGRNAEFFARAIGDSSNYASSLDFKNYGYGFNQNIQALQIGGNLLNFGNRDRHLRIGLAVTTGTTDLKPKTTQAEYSRTTLQTRALAATATWQGGDGWYADGILSYGRYNGNINTDKFASAGRIDASSLDMSVEAGRTVVMPSGVEIEPQLQLLRQSIRIDGQTDADGIAVKFDTSNYLTMRAGVRVAAAPMGAANAWKPYVRTDLLHTWSDSNQVHLSDVAFDQGTIGSSVQVALGADGQLNKNLAAYGEISGRHRIGGHGINSIGATLGIRYLF